MWTVCYTKETVLEGEVGVLGNVEWLSLMEPNSQKTRQDLQPYGTHIS